MDTQTKHESSVRITDLRELLMTIIVMSPFLAASLGASALILIRLVTTALVLAGWVVR